MTDLRTSAIKALEALWYYHATEFGRDTPAGKAITALQGALAEATQKPWRCACGANLYIDADGAPRSKA